MGSWFLYLCLRSCRAQHSSYFVPVHLCSLPDWTRAHSLQTLGESGSHPWYHDHTTEKQCEKKVFNSLGPSDAIWCWRSWSTLKIEDYIFKITLRSPRGQWVNSLETWRYGSNFKCITFKLIIQNRSFGIWCEIALRWIPQNFTNEKSTLLQVMAWCHQATSHYLSWCWPKSMSPYGMIRPQWVKICMAIWYPYLLQLWLNSPESETLVFGPCDQLEVLAPCKRIEKKKINTI